MVEPVTEDSPSSHDLMPRLHCASMTAGQMYQAMWTTDFMAVGDAVTTTELLKVQFPSLREV